MFSLLTKKSVHQLMMRHGACKDLRATAAGKNNYSLSDWVEEEAVIVGTAQSSETHGGHHSRLVDGKGLDGRWSSGTNCIKIGLRGKLTLSKRKGLPEDLFS